MAEVAKTFVYLVGLEKEMLCLRPCTDLTEFSLTLWTIVLALGGGFLSNSQFFITARAYTLFLFRR